MRPRRQKQPQVKKELCRALDDVDVDVKSGGDKRNVASGSDMRRVKRYHRYFLH